MAGMEKGIRLAETLCTQVIAKKMWIFNVR